LLTLYSLNFHPPGSISVQSNAVLITRTSTGIGYISSYSHYNKDRKKEGDQSTLPVSGVARMAKLPRHRKLLHEEVQKGVAPSPLQKNFEPLGLLLGLFYHSPMARIDNHSLDKYC